MDGAISVDFWASTAASFTFSVFTEVVAGFDIEFEVSNILFELNSTLPGFPNLCFGPGSSFDEINGCTCSTESPYDFMVYNSDLFECLCKNGIEEDGVLFELEWNVEANSCQCADRFLKREADGSCVPKSVEELQVRT